MKITKRPGWIRGKVSWGDDYLKVRALLKKMRLSSVCAEASCPNMGECWGKKRVTFMILGDTCTRNCRFCDVTPGPPEAPDPSEPERIAGAVKELGSESVVITSVTRDDLEDKGARHFAETALEIKKSSPETGIEILIPDLGGDKGLLRMMASLPVEVIGHNIEMPEALYSPVRPEADYRRSLDVLRTLSGLRDRGARILVKSAFMLGLGEKEDDILRTLLDLKETGVDIVYMGQYLSPSPSHWPVGRYYAPEEFASLEKKARGMGFGEVCAGPMVRSSYRASGS